ncbi:hypothetical protein KFK09_005462 [Dendrobium nobile]|uniref:Uncharacterized protein n=1 Tax=Dendrobium nobile TaxID=94219 RepID=A0A8T3BYC4_DENNO|nr:hypothetical protein KFK09_005462 [Dendrobium nobile]
MCCQTRAGAEGNIGRFELGRVRERRQKAAHGRGGIGLEGAVVAGARLSRVCRFYRCADWNAYFS